MLRVFLFRMGADWVLDIAELKVIWSKPYLTEAPHLIVVMKQVEFAVNLFRFI